MIVTYTQEKQEEAIMSDALWTKVATHCCVCGLTLTDATSVNCGIGPVCRRKYRYEDAFPITPEIKFQVSVYMTMNPEQFVPAFVSAMSDALNHPLSRRAANLAVYFASAEQGLPAAHAAFLVKLLGYDKLADVIMARLTAVVVSRTADGMVAIKTPYDPAFVSAIKSRYLPGREWKGKEIGWVLPDSLEAFELLERAIRTAFPGQQGSGPKGVFEIGR